MAENGIADGLICIDKPVGYTSHDIVNKIRRLFGTKKVGHTGTLDPMATGVLVVLVGRCAKASEYLLCDDKEYLAHIKLGITTDTEDVSGEILSRCDELPTEEEFYGVCERFIGSIVQVPPMYSALKVNGKKLYELARSGKTVERAGREVIVHELSAKKLVDDEYALSVRCSKGTYIRTLCADIGNACGCGGTMSYLRRTRSGDFSLSDCHTLEELEGMELRERVSLLLPTEALFSHYPHVIFPDFYDRLFKNGCAISLRKLGLSYTASQRIAVYDKDGFYALGEVFEHEDGAYIKSVKIFRLD